MLADLLPAAHSGPACTACATFATLDPADRATLDAWLRDPTVALTRIAKALQADGHHITDTTLRRHATGRCSAQLNLR